MTTDASDIRKPKKTRAHDSDQPTPDQDCARFEDENARARTLAIPETTKKQPLRTVRSKTARMRALAISDTPDEEQIGTVRNENVRAHASVIKNDDTIIRTQPGYVIGDEQEFLANGFGAMLRNMRTAQGFSQTQLKGLAGVTQPYISLLERGLRRPTPDVIKALAQALVPEDQQEYLIQRLTEEAGDSIRESWARQKLRSKSRWVRREAEDFRKRQVPKLQSQINRLYNSGRIDLAEQLEQTLEALTSRMDSQEKAAKADLAALGDDPEEPVVVPPRRAPRHFRKRSYGPK